MMIGPEPKTLPVPMHPHMSRIYAELEKNHGEVFNVYARQTSLGKILGESNQTVKNWESRGISKNGMHKLVRIIGFEPKWILTGTGPIYDAPRAIAIDETAAFIDELVKQLESARDRLADMLIGDDGQAWKEAERAMVQIDITLAKARARK